MRHPSAQRPRRMDRLATLPLFFPLDGRRIVVIGGSEAAAWKAELLSAAGAAVAVLSPEPCADMGGAGRRPARRACAPGAAVLVALGSRRRRLGGRRRQGRGGGASHIRGGSRIGRARQCYRQAGLLHLPVWRHRQPFAAGGRHFHRGGGAGVRPGDPLAHRGAAAGGLRTLGRGRQGVARRARRAEAQNRHPPPFLGGLRHPGAAGAGPRAPAQGLERAAAHRPDRFRCGGVAGPCDAGGCRPRRSGAAHPQGGAGAALGRRDPVRRSRGAGDPRLRPARGQADAGRQDRPSPLLQAGRHQRPDGEPGESGQARGAPQVRRPHDLWPGRRGDRRTGKRRDCLRRGARHQRRPGRRGQPQGVAHPPQRRPARAVRHRSRPRWPAAAGPGPRRPRRPAGDDGRLHAACHPARSRGAPPAGRGRAASACLRGIQCNPAG